MACLKEFKELPVKYVIDLDRRCTLSVEAFRENVASFVTDMLMPRIGLLLGGMDFKKLTSILSQKGVVLPREAIAAVYIELWHVYPM